MKVFLTRERTQEGESELREEKGTSYTALKGEGGEKGRVVRSFSYLQYLILTEGRCVAYLSLQLTTVVQSSCIPCTHLHTTTRATKKSRPSI